MAAVTGAAHALYLFDVAQGIDLAKLRTELGSRATTARVQDKAPGPPRLRYIAPPVIADGDAFGIPSIDGFAVRVKFYDYGVISLRLSQPFEGSWSDLVSLGQGLIENERVEQHAADVCQKLVRDVRESLDGVRSSFLDEDYLVFAVTGLDEKATADDLIVQHGADIAQLVRGERQTLSTQERDEVLRHRISYLSDDLVVPAWNATFVYDSAPAVLATMEILEFANSQLLEFRYHDDLLDAELTQIYAKLQHPKWTDRLIGRRHSRAALHLHALFIDVNELTDRMENAVKLVGDIYSARLFGIVAARLGLDHWKRNVEEKLKTLDDIYRFAVEQTGMSQANILELAIIFILLVELALFLK